MPQNTIMMVWSIYGDSDHTLNGGLITREIAAAYAERLNGHKLTNYEKFELPITSKIVRAFVVDDPVIQDRGYILVEHEYMLEEYKG